MDLMRPSSGRATAVQSTYRESAGLAELRLLLILPRLGGLVRRGYGLISSCNEDDSRRLELPDYGDGFGGTKALGGALAVGFFSG